MFLVFPCSCLCPICWSQVLSWEWRCSWSSADRRCSNYIWMINSFVAYLGATYIRGFTVHFADDISIWIGLEQNSCILIHISFEFVPYGPFDKYISISSDNGLAPNMRQTISRTQDDQVRRPICAPSRGISKMLMSSIVNELWNLHFSINFQWYFVWNFKRYLWNPCKLFLPQTLTDMIFILCWKFKRSHI